MIVFCRRALLGFGCKDIKAAPLLTTTAVVSHIESQNGVGRDHKHDPTPSTPLAACFVHKSYTNTCFRGCCPPAAGLAESMSEGRAVIRSQQREARRAGGEGSSKEQTEKSPKCFLSLPSLPFPRSIWPLDPCRWRATRGWCPALGEHTLLHRFASLCAVPGLQTHYGSVGCP